MSAHTHHHSPDDCGPCGELPAGFVRLRYFYGKRLGVIDFVDEQRYHAGKQRFHNQRLHGAGVLCGLGVGLFAPGETVLRVGKGAALDECGREIIAGYDQCIDVDAWYGRWRAERLADDPAWAPPLDGDLLRLCVALRFRECASSPEPAPRDPCACDATGSDYGRVREEFELQLLLHEDAMAHAPPAIAPPRPGLDRALGGAIAGGDLTARLRALLAAGCAEADTNGWLVLACFDAELDAARERVTSLSAPVAAATMLYSSALLEELLARDMGATLEAGAWAAGAPEIAGLALVPGGAEDLLELSLTGPIVAPTALAATYALRRLDPVTGWSPPPGAVTASYTATPPSITLKLASGFFVGDGLYRLTIAASSAEPIVDDRLRPLRPLRPSFHFRIVNDAGTLTLAPAPYAVGTT
ncbi:hypothetical protein [Sorangium sp. So ce394]|uniref:hypothetical protein n=1 Tax=Sorangium sp. So ce394 TaxID=3133310 RepID=UPI003F5BA1A1